MDLFGKKKEKERNDFLIRVYAVCKEISGSLRRIQKELDNDRICGHWVNGEFPVSVFKMNLGYLISMWKTGVLEAQLTVIPDGEELIINDSDTGQKRIVRYNSETRELEIDGYGSFRRDFENRPQQVEAPEEKPGLYEMFMNNYKRAYPIAEAILAALPETETSEWEDYRDTFLPVPEEPLVKRVHISMPTYERIRDILPQLDVTLTVSAYVENIVLNHLKAFEDSINRWVE